MIYIQLLLLLFLLLIMWRFLWMVTCRELFAILLVCPDQPERGAQGSGGSLSVAFPCATTQHYRLRRVHRMRALTAIKIILNCKIKNRIRHK